MQNSVFFKIFKNCIYLFILFTILLTSFIKTEAKEKIIIGIHGFGNKPEKDTLENWWKLSISEGLYQINCDIPFNLRLAYWSDLFNKQPLVSDSSNFYEDNYNTEPYIPEDTLTTKKSVNWFSKTFGQVYFKLRSGVLEWATPNFSGDVTLSFMNTYFKDISFYFNDKNNIKDRKGKLRKARNVVDDEIKKLIIANKDKDIMLIAHSMGSIIAYNVLSELQKEHPEIKIQYFVTIGSPLGIPAIRELLKKIQKKKTLNIPLNIKKGWYNYSDPRDGIAVISYLENLFIKEKKGAAITDIIVKNNYTGEFNKPNHHKEYGYLRTPEISGLISDFIK